MSSGGDIKKMIRLALDDGTLTERERLSRILELTNWNRSRTSWILSVSEGTIRNWIKRYDLTRK
jgi:DNA-binding protein Fis